MAKGGAAKSDFKDAALEHIDALYGFAMTLTRDPAEAQDLVQETYLRAVRAFGQLMPDSNLKSWLFAIMRNVWLNQLRHSRSGPRFVELDADDETGREWFSSVTNDPYDAFINKLKREDVRAAIDALPHRYREVVVLRDLEGFSYQQIAIIVGCPAGTVMSRLGRARERLRLVLSGWRADAAGKAMRAKEA
ncbi:MAG TPA: sigma-70 family RNA polymerase sigma factor [Blastocatellia bacterium]|nr:sigma-70 family RNA polymerase sigma factor [Blastocatellia bacterium]